MGELLRRFGGPWRARAAIGIAAKVVEVVFDLLTPLVVARMIDGGVRAGDARLVVSLGALLVALAVVGYGFTLVCQRMAAVVSQGMGTDLRDALYAHVNELSAAELDRLGTASLVTRVTSDVNQVQVAVALGVRQLVRWPLLAVGSMLAALAIDARLGLVFLVCTPLIGLAFWWVMASSVPLFASMQRRLDEISAVTREGLSGVRVVRAFRREADEERRLAAAARALAALSVAAGRLSAVLSPATFLIMNLGVVAILWVGGAQVDSGALMQGEVVAFVNYMTQTLLAIVYVANLVVVFTRGSASAGRVVEVLDAVPSVRDPGKAGPREGEGARAGHGRASALGGDAVATGRARAAGRGGTCALALRGVSFAYAGGADALRGVTLELPHAGTLGVIGGTGAGKSTLAELVVRLYDPREGVIELFGRDLHSWPLGRLRREVALVPQRATLVSGTVRSNLLWRNGHARDEELWGALEVAQAAEFVRARPGGLDEPVEAGGRNFSGGQRQRLTIARALVGAPSLVVLDDAASALDLATDARLRAALSGLEGTAKVVISQRVSAVRAADSILVLSHGEAVGLGTHDELLRDCDLYREIVASQLGEGGAA